MLLNALRYRTTASDEFQVWKFNPGRSQFSNLLCFQGSSKEASCILAALQYALSGKTSSAIKEVAVQISDDAGDTWVIERSESKLRYLKNGKTYAGGDAAKTLAMSLFDLELEPDSSQVSSKGIVQPYSLNTDHNDFNALPLDAAPIGFRKIKSMAEVKCTDLVEKIAQKLGCSDITDQKTAERLLSETEGLFFTNAEILKQKRQLLAQAKSLDEIDLNTMDRLQHEVELIQEIGKAAAPLTEPGQTPKYLKEKLQKIDQQLADELKACGLTAVPLTKEPIAWTKLAKARCKLEAYEKLIEASESTLDFAQSKLESVHQDYIETVESLLSSDSQITAELESCLATLNLQLSAINTSPAKSTLGDSIARFIKPSAGVPESTEQVEGRLESSRMAVDFALARLGELHASVAQASDDHEVWKQKLEDRQEELIEKYGKIKSHWSAQATASQLPEATDLKELINIMGRHSQLVELWNQKQHFRRVYTERKSQLEHLEKLVLEHRQVTGSQKETLLTTQSLLISEAQGILRYQQKKEKQLSKLREYAEHIRAYNVLKTNILSRDQAVQNQWQGIFQGLGLTEVDPCHAGWRDAYDCGRQLKSWSAIRSECERPLSNNDIFAAEAASAPLNVYLMKETNLANKLRLKLLQLLEDKEQNRQILLLVADPVLAEMLVKSGAGRGRPVSGKKKSSPQTQTMEKREEQTQVKAQAVLDLLKPRPLTTS